MSNLITITTQPVGANIIKNTSGTFTVAATAQTSPITVNSITYNFTSIRYEWYKNNVLVPAPFGRETSFTPLPISSTSTYYVNVIAKYTNPLNQEGDPSHVYEATKQSDVVALTVIDRPELADDQPGLALKQIVEGESATLSVVLTSPNNTVFYYQWYEGGSGLENNPIQNAVNALYTTPNLTSTRTYWVKAYNLYNDYANSINSPSVRVEVLSAQQNTRQSNINKINSLTKGTNGDKLVDLNFAQLQDDFVNEAVQIEATKLLKAFPSIPNIPGTAAAAYVTTALNDFDEASIRIVSQAESLVDCAKDIPQRLINAGIAIAKKLLLNLISNITGIAFADLIALANALAKIIEIADQFILSVVSAAVGAAVEAVGGALAAAENALGELVDICNSFPYTTENGDVASKPTNIPTGTPPSGVRGVINPVGNSSYDPKPKNDYDGFIFQLKEYLSKDPAKADDASYTRMISVINTTAYSYHDNIRNSVNADKDAEYKATYRKLVSDELSKHPEWDAETKLDYNNRTTAIENQISRNTDVIRAFYRRNSEPTGSFSDWFAAQGFRNFTAADFTSYFARDKNGVKNSTPPSSIWKNIVPTLRIVDDLRDSLGASCTITSSYRSPAYNKAIGAGAAKNSLHIQFKALDIVFDGISPQIVYNRLLALRQAGKFSGGLGLYSSFVHIDTRGSNSTWRG